MSDAAHHRDDESIDLRAYAKAVFARRWTVLACAVAVFTVTAIWAFRITPSYNASARVLIERRLPRLMPFDEPQEYRDENYLQTQVKLITSRTVLERALENPEMAVYFKPSPAPMERPSLPRLVTGELRALLGRHTTRAPEPWERLSASVRATPVRGTNLVDIQTSSTSPASAALVANAVAEAYVQTSLASRQETAGETIKTLQELRREQEKQLAEAERRLQAFREGISMAPLAGGTADNPLVARLRALNEEYTRIQVQRTELHAALLAVEQAPDHEALLSLLSVQPVRTGREIEEVHSQLVEVELALRAAQAGYGAKHPKVVSLQERAAYLEERLRDLVSKAAQSIRVQHGMLQERERKVLHALQEQDRKVVELSRKMGELDRLRTDAERQARVFDVIITRMQELDLTKDTGQTNIILMDRAAIPRVAARPNKPRMLAMGAFLGIVIGVTVALVLERLDDTVKASDDLEQQLGVPTLGAVPLMLPDVGAREGFSDRARHSATNARTAVTDALRAIRTAIYFSFPQGHARSLLVTSPEPGDGKTVFAANLAVLMAIDGKKVLLVDTDLRRPSVHAALRLAKAPGITNILVEGLPFSEAVRSMPLANMPQKGYVDVITAGADSLNPAELLGGAAMANFMNAARERYDVVIYDAPPVMFIADNAATGRAVDGVVLVARAGKCRRENARRAMRTLQSVGAKVVGTVVNGVRDESSHGYYGYSGYGAPEGQVVPDA